MFFRCEFMAVAALSAAHHVVAFVARVVNLRPDVADGALQVFFS
jgi:hypothetical protein